MNITTMIVEILVSIAAIALPALGAMAYKRFKGNAKFQEAVSLITNAINALKAYVVLHPEIAQDAQAIYNFIKTRVLAVLPLTDEEFDYLFESFEAAIAALLGIDMTMFSKLNLKTASTNAVLSGRAHHRLFT